MRNIAFLRRGSGSGPARSLAVRARIVQALALAGLALLAACSTGNRPAVVREMTATPSPEPPAGPVFALLIDDEQERARVTEAIEGAGHQVVDSVDAATVVLADRPFEGGLTIVVDAWAAATDQRRDVLEFESSHVRRAFGGELTDWAQLGGSAMPISLFLAQEDAARVAMALGLPGFEDADVTLLPRAAVVETVAATPGALALVRASDLRPGVLALVADSHDPLRDAERGSPLRLERWVRAPDGDQLNDALRLAGWQPRQLDFEPVSMLATGDIIPVRCTYAQIARRGYGAMFDGTRDLLQAAGIVLSPLDAGLTDRRPATPCIATTVLSAPTAIAEAMAEAGIDVVTMATNHHMDCYGGCAAADVHRDTMAALEAAGMLAIGAGENLEAARQPAFLERGGIRFAFLGYDAISAHWFAGADSPGTAPLRWDTLESLAEDVARAKAQADHVVVAFSWSYTEYVTNPDDLQREAARVVAEAGGSLVVGNHPHIVQASEMIGETFVIYALGNFIFDQDWSQETLDLAVMEVGFTRDQLIGYRMRPGVIREVHRPELVNPAGPEGRRILDRLWSATDALAR